MHGNVAEWCHAMPESAQTDVPHREARNTPARANPILRGGAWDDAPDKCRSAPRKHTISRYANDDTGFRILLEFHMPPEQ